MIAFLRHAALAAVCLAVAPLSSTFAVDIVDGGKFFSPQTIESANRKIAELEQRHATEIRIESFAAVPAADQARVAAMDKTARAKYFSQWLHDCAVAEKAKGVFLLICREPGHLRIDVTASLRGRGFGNSARDAVTEVMRVGFGRKEYDAALLGGLEQLDRQLGRLSAKSAAAPAAGFQHPAGQHAPGGHAPADNGMTNLLVWGAVIVGGIFLLSLLMRAVTGGAAGGPGGGWGGGGGGFGTSLMGGLFGAMAGHWLYDQFTGGSSAHAADHWGSADPNRHAGETGGDFNSDYSSGGGDFGGSDFGGGDFGGGDF